MFLVILTEKKLLERFTKKNCKKQTIKSLEWKKYNKRKGDKLYVKWKDYNNYFNSWIHKKDNLNESIFSQTRIFRSKCES